jgi:hypothetical protein
LMGRTGNASLRSSPKSNPQQSWGNGIRVKSWHLHDGLQRYALMC